MKLLCQMVFTLLVSLSYIIGNVSSAALQDGKVLSDVSWQEEMIYALEVAPLAKPRIVPVACYTPFPSDLSASYFIRDKKLNPSIIGAENDVVSVYAISGSERHGQLVVTYHRNAQKEGNPTSIGILDIASGKIRAN